MGSGRTWTKDEKALLRLWIAENPDEYVTTCTVPKSLAGLFPDRRPSTIGKMLYHTRRQGAVDGSATLKPELQKEPAPPKSLPRFTELFDLFINKILDEEVAKFVEVKVNAQKDEGQKALDALLDENANLQRSIGLLNYTIKEKEKLVEDANRGQDRIYQEYKKVEKELSSLKKQLSRNNGNEEAFKAIQNENLRLSEELDKCKDILRKLTPIREACERFKL